MANIIRGAEAPEFDHWPGVRLVGLAAPSRGSAEVCTVRFSVEAGADGPPAHWLDRDAVLMVTAGELRITQDGTVLHAGDTVVVPAGEPMQASNPGTQPAVGYFACTAGFTVTLDDGTKLVDPPWAQ